MHIVQILPDDSCSYAHVRDQKGIIKYFQNPMRTSIPKHGTKFTESNM